MLGTTASHRCYSCAPASQSVGLVRRLTQLAFCMLTLVALVRYWAGLQQPKS